MMLTTTSLLVVLGVLAVALIGLSIDAVAGLFRPSR
jgi:hypothetical protein